MALDIMKIIVLGSGTFIPELNRNCSSYLIEIEKEKIIFDFGRGTIDNLLKLKISLYDLKTIFISHMHTDHSSELSSFISFILNNPDKTKLKKTYFIYGSKGIKNRINKLLKAFDMHKHKNLNKIKVVEISTNKKIKNKNWIVDCFNAKHSPKGECLSYRLISDRKIIFYSGDSAYSKNLIKGCKNADLAILEATLPKRRNSKEHMDGQEAGEIAQKGGVKNLLLTHVANTYLPEVIQDLKKSYAGKFSIAKDLMQIKL